MFHFWVAAQLWAQQVSVSESMTMYSTGTTWPAPRQASEGPRYMRLAFQGPLESNENYRPPPQWNESHKIMWNFIHYFLIKFKWKKKIWFSGIISLIFSKPKKNIKINTNFLKRIKRNPNCANKTAPWILLQSGFSEAITWSQRAAPWTRPPAFKSDSITGQTWDSGQTN